MATRPVVYAVVLHWRTPDLTTRCLRSLSRQVGHGSAFELRLLVVDNGSGDAPEPCVSAGLDFEVLKLPRNTGFAGGNNAGLEHALAAGADYVLLANSDIVAAPDCVCVLLEAAARDPHAGLLGPLVLRELQPSRIESNGQRFGRYSARHVELDRGRDASEIGTQPRCVDTLSGCAMFASRGAALAVGGLDERLFLYFEDVDWCLRARAAGLHVVVVPRARVWHRGGGSQGGAVPRATLYAVRNHLTVAARASRFRAPRVIWPLIVGYHLAHVLRTPARRSPAHLAAIVRGAWHAWRRQLGEEA